MILALWNVLVCVVISLVCWSYLLGSRAEDKLSIAANVGLLLLAVGMFVSAFAPLGHDASVGWWSVLARTGGAVVAVALYERRFGTRSQALALALHFMGIPARLLDAWQRVRDAYRLVRR